MQKESISIWCRENLSRDAAENDLRSNRKGTFLVWRSQSPNNLYLSYFEHDGCIHHRPVKQLGRYFFLEGSKFHSLSELVVYHLTMRQFSDNPVKITNTQTSDKLEATHISLKDMDYSSGETIVSTYRGDLLAEVGRLDDRWMLSKHLPSESFVFFDLKQTSFLSDMDAPPDALPYFHENMGEDKEDLVQRFSDSGCGSFLIRESRKNVCSYVLLVHTGEKINKFLLEKVKGSKLCGWRLSGRVFSSISQIIHRYSARPIHAKTCLTHSILSSALDNEMHSYPFTCATSFPLTSCAAISPSEDPSEIRQINKKLRVARDSISIACADALYKCREENSWRSCTLALYEHFGTAILKIRDSVRTNLQTLILHQTELICLHDSIFGKEAAVFISPLDVNDSGAFLAFEPLHFYTWFHLLRRYTMQRRVDVICPSPTSAMNYYSGFPVESAEMSLLSLHIDKYKGSMLKTDTPHRAVISLNGVAMAHTAYQTPVNANCLVFDAHFLMTVTSWACNMQLTIIATGKSRPIAASSGITVPISSMILPSLLSITPVRRKPSIGTSVDQFVATCTRQKITVLSIDVYAPLLESLMDEVLSLAEWGNGKLTTKLHRNLLCSVLVTLAWPHALQTLIERTLGKTIQETSGENMLRQDSFSSCLITAALRLSGKSALEERIIQGFPREDVQTEEWLVGILVDVASIPAVSLVLACIAATVATHLPDEDKEHVVRRAISAAFVLRFANPLIISTLSSYGGAALARGVQIAANTATMHNFIRNNAGDGTATRLFDLFERIRYREVHSMRVEGCNESPEQCALLCHLLALALSSNHTVGNVHPAGSIMSTSTSSSTLTSSESSMASSSVGSTDSTVYAETELALPSTLRHFSPFSALSHGHPEMSHCLARLLELHRS